MSRDFSNRCRATAKFVGADEQLHRIDGRESRQTEADVGSSQPAQREFARTGPCPAVLPWSMKQGSRTYIEELKYRLVAACGRKGVVPEHRVADCLIG